MSQSTSNPVLDRLIDPLSRCLNEESAKRLLKLKADPKLQNRVDKLAKKNSAGTLTPSERAEYQDYVTFGTFVALLKSKARLLLSQIGE